MSKFKLGDLVTTDSMFVGHVVEINPESVGVKFIGWWHLLNSNVSQFIASSYDYYPVAYRPERLTIVKNPNLLEFVAALG